MQAGMKKQYEIWEVTVEGCSFSEMKVRGRLDGVISLEDKKGRVLVLLETDNEIFRVIERVLNPDNKENLLLLAADPFYMDKIRRAKQKEST